MTRLPGRGPSATLGSRIGWAMIWGAALGMAGLVLGHFFYGAPTPSPSYGVTLATPTTPPSSGGTVSTPAAATAQTRPDHGQPPAAGHEAFGSSDTRARPGEIRHGPSRAVRNDTAQFGQIDPASSETTSDGIARF